MKRITSFSMILAISLLFIFSESFADKRMVLMEEFTNASCGPCASQNPSFETYLSQNKTDIIPIVFHPNFPGSDLMYNFAPAMEEGRLAYYAVNGVPTVLTNGKKHTPSSGWYDGAPGDINGLTLEVSKYAGTQSPITITPTYTMSGKTMSINVSVNSTEALSGKILRIALVEAYHYYDKAGSNGEKNFYYVVRQMFPDFKGQAISLNANETKEFPYQVDLKLELFKQFAYIVAYVQDDATKEVLQAGQTAVPDFSNAENYSKVSLNLTLDASQKHGFVQSGVAQSRKFTIQNPTAKEIKAGVEVNADVLPKDWSITLDKSEVTIPAQGSVEVNAIVTAGATVSYAGLQVVAAPLDLPDNVLSVANSVSAYALSKNTKYVYYFGMTYFQDYLTAIVSNATKYSKDVAFIPMLDVDALQAYPPSNFEAMVYSFDYLGISNAKGVLGNNYTQSVAIRQNIKDATAAGKDVLIIAENEIFTAMNTAADVNGQAFFKNDLGVGCAQALQRVTVNSQGQITGVSSYTVQGETSDPISNGLSLTCNNHQYSGNYFTIQTDLLTLEANSKAVPFLYYDNDKTKIGGVRLENANGAKTVFMTSPLVGYDINSAVSLYTKIIDWFNAAPTPKAPQIASSVSTINFSSVNINSTDTRDVEISNTGEQDLVLSSIAIEDDASGMYSITSGGNLTKLTKGSKGTITVKFAPTDTKTYTGTLRIKSNSTTNNDLKITLSGKGTSTSVDEELFNKFMTVSVGPNPVKEVSTVSYTLVQASQNVTMKMIDQAGRTVAELLNGNIAAGTYSVQLNAANYPAGVYYLISSVNGVSSQIPVVIIK